MLGPELSRLIDDRKPLKEIGFDSLMGVELRTILASALGRSFPVSLFYDYPTIWDISDYLAQQVMPRDPPHNHSNAGSIKVDYSEEVADLEQLTEAELASLLATKLKD